MTRLRIYAAISIVAVAASVILLGFMFHQAQLKRQTEHVESVAQGISQNLSDYMYNRQYLPDSLKAAGVQHTPSYIKYKKLSGHSYSLCVTYKSPYFDPSWYSQCKPQTVYLSGYVQNRDGSYTVCGVRADSFSLSGYIVPPTYKTPNAVDINGEIFVFSGRSKAFDTDCNPLQYSDLHVGDKIDAFNIVTSHVAWPNTPSPVITIFLKHS